jgi:ABC-type glycerol-3-phosphate transport system substrate-binding protein
MRKNIKHVKSYIFVFAIMVSVTLILSGCSAKNSSISSSKPLEGMTLTVAINSSSDNHKVLHDMLKQYGENTGVKIKFSVSPDSGSASRFSSGSGPDVYAGSFHDVDSKYKKGWLYDFQDLYSEKSRYDPANYWQSSLPDAVLDYMTASEQSSGVAGYPASADVVRIYYNKSIFDDAGLNVPKTWNDFIKTCRILKERGITPFAFPNGSPADMPWTWFNESITSQLNNGFVNPADISGNGYIEQNEAAKAYNRGDLDFTSTNILRGYSLMKEFSRYWEPSYNNVNTEDSIRMFTSGQAAMVMATSNDYSAINDSASKNFDFRVMPIPEITTDTAVSAMSKSVVILEQPESVYCINNRLTKNKSKLAAAIDITHYMTSSAAQTELAQNTNFIPVSRNAKYPENLKGFKIKEAPLYMHYYTGMGNDFNNTFHYAGQAYLNGAMTREEFARTVNSAYGQAIDKISKASGWNNNNNYKIKKEKIDQFF